MSASSQPPCNCFARVCVEQGYREAAAAQLFSAAVPLAPTIDEKQMFARHCLDELEHYEAVSMQYDELGGEDLLGKVKDRLARLPKPESWLEMVIIGLVFDRAVYYQLRAYAMAPDKRIASMAVYVIADEQEHLAASQAALADIAHEDKALAERAGVLLDRWLPIALACFDGPEPECPHGPHLSTDALDAARRAYFDGLAAVLVPVGIAAERFAGS